MWYDCKHGFKDGTRVVVYRQRKYKNTMLLGKTGTVKGEYGSEVAVHVDGMRNSYGSTGYFYFKPADIRPLSETIIDSTEDKNMTNIINYLNAVKIQFIDENKPCPYIYANFEADLKVGDLCVVKPAHHSLALARVVDVVDRNDCETTREIVAKVYTDFYDERVANRAKVAELKAKMQERAKQLQDIALYQMLAKDDPDMMDLLNEYQALPKM